MDEEPRIRDNPSIKKLVDDTQNFSKFKQAMPILGPILRLLGADVDKLSETLEKAEELAHEAAEIARVPDEFNGFFADRGWIMYDQLSFSVAKAAVEKAKRGDIDGAESDLVAYFDGDTVRWGVGTMRAVVAFRPRMELARKALLDYEEGRYHACVPVVLALLDGMVNEIHEKARGIRRGISADGADLSAWDSFAAHQSGLNRLLKVVQSGRRKTTTEEIRLPFRNGIMHGIDLGYDNQVVAAKTWALLFAAREWAMKAERGDLDAPPAEATPTLRETWNQMKEGAGRLRALDAFKQRLKDWKPRTIVVGRDAPRTGPPEAFPEGTPERALAEYLSWWQQRNYGYMARQATMAGLHGLKNAPARIRDEFKSKRLIAYTLESIVDDVPAITVITTNLVMEVEGEIVNQQQQFRILFAGSDGMAAVLEEGQWAVLTWAL